MSVNTRAVAGQASSEPAADGQTSRDRRDTLLHPHSAQDAPRKTLSAWPVAGEDAAQLSGAQPRPDSARRQCLPERRSPGRQALLPVGVAAPLARVRCRSYLTETTRKSSSVAPCTAARRKK